MGSVGSLFATIGADSSGFQKGMAGASSSLQGFGKSILAQTLGIASLTGALMAAGKFISSSVNDWADYNLEMNKGSIATGLMVDEYSRLIQAADDAFVSQESITKAMELATKNGYPITIDSLGQIADKLNAMTNPAAKAKAAMEIFGKGWADIMPFLAQGSAGIDAATAAIKDNLIATNESVNNAKAYKLAIDDMTDAWTGFRNQIGSALMPTLTNTMNGITAGNDLRSKTIEITRAGIITENEYIKALKTDALNSNTKAMQALYDAHAQEYELQVKSNQALYAAQDAWDMNTRSMGGAVDDSAALAAEYERIVKLQTDLTNVFSLTSNFGNIISFAQQYTDIQDQIAVKQAEYDALPGWKKGNKWNQASVGAKQLLADIDDLKQGYTQLAKKMTLDMFQATIAIGGVTDAEMGAYLNMAVDMGFISKEGADAATAAYNEAIGTINAMGIDEKTGNVTADASAAYAVFDALEAYGLADKTMRVQIKVGEGLSSGSWDQEANGGPVSGNTPYIVGERGPELFVPESNGQIIPNNQMAGQGAGVTNIFNLTMPTTANAGDVRMAFELMEAWA